MLNSISCPPLPRVEIITNSIDENNLKAYSFGQFSCTAQSKIEKQTIQANTSLKC